MNPNEYNSKSVPEFQQTTNRSNPSAANKEAEALCRKDGSKECGNVKSNHVKICCLLFAIFLVFYLPLVIKIIQLDTKLKHQTELKNAWEEEYINTKDKEGNSKENPYVPIPDIINTMPREDETKWRFKRDMPTSGAGSQSVPCTNMTRCRWVKQVTEKLAREIHTEVKRRAARPYAHVVGIGNVDSASSTCVRSANTYESKFRWKDNASNDALSTTNNLPYKALQRSLEIMVTGAYYVYTQITCNGKKNRRTATACGFETVLKPNQRTGGNKPTVVLMHSLVDQIRHGLRHVSTAQPRNSMYHGGVFLLEAGDQIYVKPDDSSLCPYVFINHERKAFFGAFLIYSDNLNQ